jgi:hypothetical protein
MSTTANATSNTTVTQEAQLEQLSLMVVAAMASGVALLIFMVIQLCYRTTTRHARLSSRSNRYRFEARYAATKDAALGEILMGDALDARAQRDAIASRPPMHKRRVMPTIYDGRDAKVECRRMLSELRSAVGNTFGCTPNMTMRGVLQCIQSALDPHDVERFCSVYDAVMFGIHKADGTVGDVNNDDLKFLASYFGKIIKEI